MRKSRRIFLGVMFSLMVFFTTSCESAQKAVDNINKVDEISQEVEELKEYKRNKEEADKAAQEAKEKSTSGILFIIICLVGIFIAYKLVFSGPKFIGNDEEN